MNVGLAQASAHAIPLRDEVVQTVVCSPPYWGLRSYAGEQRFVWGGDAAHEHEWGPLGPAHHPGQVPDGKHQHEAAASGGQTAGSGHFCPCGAWYGALGLEPTPDLYVEHMVAIFREVRRVLRPDGTLWLNLGDSYAASRSGPVGENSTLNGSRHAAAESRRAKDDAGRPHSRWTFEPWGLKPKDLVGIPWRVAFALQEDGWWLRSDIVWSKPNPMPESVTDRPTRAHEYLFLLTKGQRYYYDQDAVREPYNESSLGRYAYQFGAGEAAAVAKSPAVGDGSGHDATPNPAGRNIRSVWHLATQPYPGAHFATYPEKLVEPCILAGSARGDLVLDPFNGSGTTGRVAIRHGRSYIGLDVSREYLVEQSQKRMDGVQMAAF